MTRDRVRRSGPRAPSGWNRPAAGSFTTARDDRADGEDGEVANKPEAPTNWAQARARIDRGETGDKIAVDDPAAAPLGTDAEAGGASTAATDIARSAELQSHGGEARAAAQAPRTAGRRQLVPWLVVILALAIAVIAALLIAK